MLRPLIIITLLAALGAHGVRTATARCSKVPGPPIGLKRARAIYMIGVPLPDTVRSGAGTREWRGRVELPFIEKLLLAGLVVTDRVPGSESHGTFVLGRDGRLRAEMVIGKATGRPLVFRGERISNVLVDASW